MISYDLVPRILKHQMSMSNISARSAQGFTLREKRLFVAGVSKINSHHLSKPLSLKERTLNVTAKEYAAIAGTKDYRDAYKDLKAASNNLPTFVDLDGDADGTLDSWDPDAAIDEQTWATNHDISSGGDYITRLDEDADSENIGKTL